MHNCGFTKNPLNGIMTRSVAKAICKRSEVGEILVVDSKILFEEIDSLNDKYIKFLREVVEIESPTAFKEGVDKVADFFVAKAQELGFKTEIYSQEVAGNVAVITMNPEVKERPVCISGHIDTVHPVGAFGTPATRIENDVIIGPGIADCKGGCVCGLWAMEVLAKLGYKKRPVMLLLQSDEETSSRESNKDTINYICERSKDAVCFLNVEPCYHDGVTLERRGIAKFKFTIKGIPEHASTCYNGANAIAEAAHKILELEKFKEVGGTTCSCGLIEGGTAINTVPDECIFYLDTRFKSVEAYENIKKTAQKIADTAFIEGTLCELEEISVRPAMEAAKINFQILDKANDILEKCGLDRLKITNSSGGSDAAYVTVAKIPVIDSIGIVGGFVHTRQEFVYKDKISLCTKRLASIVGNL